MDRCSNENEVMDYKGVKVKNKMSVSSVNNIDYIRGQNTRQFGRDITNNIGFVNNNIGSTKDIVMIKNINEKQSMNRKESINSKNSKKSRNSNRNKVVNINTNVVNINKSQVRILLFRIFMIMDSMGI
jgi:hypothetical protein